MQLISGKMIWKRFLEKFILRALNLFIELILKLQDQVVLIQNQKAMVRSPTEWNRTYCLLISTVRQASCSAIQLNPPKSSSVLTTFPPALLNGVIILGLAQVSPKVVVIILRLHKQEINFIVRNTTSKYLIFS